MMNVSLRLLATLVSVVLYGASITKVAHCWEPDTGSRGAAFTDGRMKRTSNYVPHVANDGGRRGRQGR